MKLAVLCSLILSILHSILFYGQRWGISVLLFTIAGLFVWIFILQKKDKIKEKKALLISIPIILLSSTYFIFNNSFFNFFNIIVIFFLFAVMTIIATTGNLKISQFFKNSIILFLGPVEEMGEATREFSNCFSKKEVQEKEKSKLWKQIGKGILCSLPVLILVIALLATADEMFASFFNYLFSKLISLIHLRTIYSLLLRVFIIILLMLYFIGMLIKVKKDELKNEEKIGRRKLKIQVVTLNTLLTMLNMIYLLFTITQGIYFIKQMNQGMSLNYAQYARTGFFQLMVVSIINFVVLFLCKRNQKEASVSSKNYTKIMNVLLAIFTIIILVSSVIRMNLYEKEYGYTFLRIMVYWIQLTELILIFPTIIYILKEKFNIAKWYIVVTISMYLILNFMNIDYIIAKGNIDRYFNRKEQEKAKIDFSYLKKKTRNRCFARNNKVIRNNRSRIKSKSK